MPTPTAWPPRQENPNVRLWRPLAGPVVTSPRPCPVCGQAMTGRKTSACSDRCPATLSGHRHGSVRGRIGRCGR